MSLDGVWRNTISSLARHGAASGSSPVQLAASAIRTPTLYERNSRMHAMRAACCRKARPLRDRPPAGRSTSQGCRGRITQGAADRRSAPAAAADRRPSSRATAATGETAAAATDRRQITTAGSPQNQQPRTDATATFRRTTNRGRTHPRPHQWMSAPTNTKNSWPNSPAATTTRPRT